MSHLRAFLSRMSWLRAFWGRILHRILAEILGNTQNFGRNSERKKMAGGASARHWWKSIFIFASSCQWLWIIHDHDAKAGDLSIFLPNIDKKKTYHIYLLPNIDGTVLAVFLHKYCPSLSRSCYISAKYRHGGLLQGNWGDDRGDCSGVNNTYEGNQGGVQVKVNPNKNIIWNLILNIAVWCVCKLYDQNFISDTAVWDVKLLQTPDSGLCFPRLVAPKAR